MDGAAGTDLGMTLEELAENFSNLDDWEDKYAMVIDLGRKLPPLATEDRNEHTRVRGCQSQVWLVEDVDANGRIHLRGDSDALIVRGLVAVMLLIFSGKTAAEIRSIDAQKILDGLGLRAHLSPQRANGLFSMVERIQRLAGA